MQNQPQQVSKSVVCILNRCLRVTDSQMHNFTATTKLPVTYILLRIGGVHKQAVDAYFAQSLGIQIHIAGPEHTNVLQQLFTHATIVYQNVVEIRRVVQSIASNAGVCEMMPFNDWLALDRNEFAFSPVFSVFSKRAIRAIKKAQSGELIRAIKLATSSAKVRGLPLLNVQTELNVPTLEQTIKQFRSKVERGYGRTRNAFGALFDYQQPSSSFLSLYISAGRVSIRQLIEVCTDATFKQELLWNQYCELYIEHYGDSVCSAEYGPYNRSQVKWLSRAEASQLIKQMISRQTDVPLINAIMNQLIQTGFVPNRLRMVFASWCFQQRLDWRVACRLFEEYLIDYAEASNVFNWQFGYNLTLGRPHVFSIERQLKRFDPKGEYVKRWGSVVSRE